MTGRVVILYRESMMEADELRAASTHFPMLRSRLDVRQGDIVVSRYSAVPFYEEQAEDITRLGARLVNTWSEHRFVSDLGQWAPTLDGYTPRTWSHPDAIEGDGPFVVKGATYSRKGEWYTHMYAPDRAAARVIYERLRQDPLTRQDSIYLREYVRLRDFGTMPSGLPISNEFRFFVLDGVIVDGGFYWSEYARDSQHAIDEVPTEWLQTAIGRIGRRSRFYTVDVAELASGGWAVIDIGDGQMAGLSTISSDRFYMRLHNVFKTGRAT